ncbi:uncharacterized protein LOC132196544 isoform X2 [Neocloeon triangulifer]|uniref:uncharacterized protein LOC132196544 isoform X2 n=1 Tax=Neocloeon triangulifer TaxID=2078957 RepID=UPI00286F2018|nr:uncharacterized protein LOC132196544 isoform X2 [Neocloeon triangulifer]
MHRSVRNAQLQQPPPVGWREGVFNETKVVSRPYLIAEFEPTEDFADLLMTPNGPGTIAMPPRSNGFRITMRKKIQTRGWAAHFSNFFA